MCIELALMRTAHVIGTQVILAQINMAHISVAQINLAQLHWFIWSGSNRFGLCELGSNGLDQVSKHNPTVIVFLQQ